MNISTQIFSCHLLREYLRILFHNNLEVIHLSAKIYQTIHKNKTEKVGGLVKYEY